MDTSDIITKSNCEEHVQEEIPELAEVGNVSNKPAQERNVESQSSVESKSDAPVTTTNETLVLQGIDKSANNDPSPKPFLTPGVAPFKLPSLPFKKTQKWQLSEVTSLNKSQKELGDSSSHEPSKDSKASPDSSKHIPEAEADISKDNSSENAGKQNNTGHLKKKRKKQEPSPAEKLNIPPLPYKDPSWGGIPDKRYSLEILKSGNILETIDLNEKSFYVFGRLETCDVTLEHPSISRYHLVLQYRAVGDSERDPGFYIYDLASTHGSQFNKGPMKSRVYYRVRVGHQFKLGGSTRIFILQGPPEDEEAESELSVTELKELRRKQLEEQEELKRKQEEKKMETTVEEPKEAGGISWGIRDDAEEEIDMEKNPYNVMNQAEKEESYVKDPKKTLRGYFEREGLELEYNVEEKGSGFNHEYLCKVELPVDDAEGEPITAEAAVSGKKKESVIACAMEACRILDAHGVLRQAVHESKHKKKKNWADDDYYDSDDDSYLDRTGLIEKKRTRRMMKAGVIKQEVDTYESLLVKLSNVNEEVEKTQKALDILKQDQSTGQEEDTLDAFIDQLKSGKTVDKTKRAKMKLRTIELKKEQARLQRLVKLVQPTSVTMGSQKDKSQSNFATLSQRLPMKGFMKGRKIPHSKAKIQISLADSSTNLAPTVSSRSKTEEHEEEEEEEDEEEGDDGDDNKEEADKGEINKQRKGTTSQISHKMEHSSEDLPAKDVSGRTSEQKSDEQNPTEEKKTEAKKPARVSPTQPRRPKRVLGPQMGPIIKFKQFMNRDEPESSSTSSERPDAKKRKDEEFADWIPPDDQKGDGRTFLNAKYGY